MTSRLCYPPLIHKLQRSLNVGYCKSCNKSTGKVNILRFGTWKEWYLRHTYSLHILPSQGLLALD